MTDQPQPRIAIAHFEGRAEATTAREMAELAGAAFPIGGRVTGATGLAFDWGVWHDAWRAARGIPAEPAPTHLKVEAADGFEAVIPWSQLADAAVLFASEDGAPLGGAGPVRLYAPQGESACLNVKRVVAFRLLRETGEEPPASYGFKRLFTPEELTRRGEREAGPR